MTLVMSFWGIKEWLCSYLQPNCTYTTEGILKPVYKTICFLHKTICDKPDDAALKPSYSDTHTPKLNISKSKCYLTHYFNQAFERISSSTCNITISPTKSQLIEQSSNNTCKITDYFGIWLNETPNAVISRVTEEKRCSLNWCGVHDYFNYWWKELHKSWCSFSDCFRDPKMLVKHGTEVTIAKNGESRFEQHIRRWISQNLGIEWPRNVSFIPFFIFSVAGGIFLFLCFLDHKSRSQKKKDVKSSSRKVENVNGNVEVELPKTLEETKKSNEKNFNEYSKTIQDLDYQLKLQNKEYHELQLEINDLKGKNTEREKELMRQRECSEVFKEQAREVDKKCKKYENEIDFLCKKLHDFQENHKIEINSHEEENKKIQNRVTETQSRLKLSSQLHENEIKQLHQDIAMLQVKLKEKANENDKLYQMYQQNLLETEDRLKNAEKVCIQQRDLINNLQRSNVVETSQVKVSDEQASNMKSELSHQEDPYVVESLNKIKTIFIETQNLERLVEEFSGSDEDKGYLHLNELLIRNTVKLDNVETQGFLVIRKKRKEAVAYVQKCMSILENKVKR